MNTIVLSGTLVEKPDLRYTGSGTAILKIRIGGSGERTHYHTITIIGEKAEGLADGLEVGDTILMTGEVSQRKGADGRTYTSILARTVRKVQGTRVEEGREVGAVNHFSGVGFLATDPEERVEGRLVRARVAFNRRTKDGQEAVFLRVEAWEELGDVLRGLRKGAQVFVEGSLRARTYEAQGEKRYELYISARSLKPLGWVGAKEASQVEKASEEAVEDFPPPEDLPF